MHNINSINKNNLGVILTDCTNIFIVANGKPNINCIGLFAVTCKSIYRFIQVFSALLLINLMSTRR
jgi:hypothetical protein